MVTPSPGCPEPDGHAAKSMALANVNVACPPVMLPEVCCCDPLAQKAFTSNHGDPLRKYGPFVNTCGAVQVLATAVEGTGPPLTVSEPLTAAFPLTLRLPPSDMVWALIEPEVLTELNV